MKIILMLTTTILAAASTQAAIDWTHDHPVTTFTGERKALLKRIRPLEERTDSRLAEWWTQDAAGWTAANEQYDAALRAAIALWQQTGKDTYRDLAIAAAESALGDLLTETDEQLAGHIDERGVKNPDNVRLRNACRLFAYLYVLNERHAPAHKAALLLSRFADVIPRWHIYVPHHGEHKWSRECPQTSEGFYRQWDATGLWGTWIYGDTHAAAPLLEAYDLILPSRVLQAMGRLDAVQAMLRRHVEIQFIYGRAFSNMDGAQMRGILAFARILREPEWVHSCVTWLRDMYTTQFYADGWWHEGTPSYHKQIHHSLKGLFSDWLNGYSDPPGFVSSQDGTRFDNLNLETAVGDAIRRADRALALIQQPNRICQVLNDTVFPQPVWWTPPMTEAASVLFGSMGHAILGTGKGRNSMTQASLSFGGTHGHEHFDCLNLILFAKGHELISETRYRPQNVTNTTREWHGMTAGHATVVVDELNQTSRNSDDARAGGCVREPQPEDEIPGVPDWPWRWQGHGNMMNDGKLRLFNTDFPMVQVVEADGERAYRGCVNLQRYRRTVALVKIDEGECYVVDIFRVRGGTTHDYMLHSCLEAPHAAKIEPELNWTPGPEALHTYIGSCRQARTDDAWQVTFALNGTDVALRSFLLPQPGTTVLYGDAPAMRRQGVAPFLAIRTQDGDSVFVAVHHPFSGRSVVQRVEAIALRDGGDQAVALRVVLPEAVDTIVCTGGETDTAVAADDSFAIRGAFSHWRQSPTGAQWVYAAATQSVRTPLGEVRGQTGYKGTVRSTKRIENGQPCNAFVAEAGTLPARNALAGHALIVDIGGLLTQSVVITDVLRDGNNTLIVTDEEPGMTVSPDMIKLVCYPGWGIRGDARFTIAGSALMSRQPGQPWQCRATGRAETVPRQEP